MPTAKPWLWTVSTTSVLDCVYSPGCWSCLQPSIMDFVYRPYFWLHLQPPPSPSCELVYRPICGLCPASWLSLNPQLGTVSTVTAINLSSAEYCMYCNMFCGKIFKDEDGLELFSCYFLHPRYKFCLVNCLWLYFVNVITMSITSILQEKVDLLKMVTREDKWFFFFFFRQILKE